MTYHYLASPYSSPDPAIMHERALAAQQATAWLLIRRTWVYSPIVHCHELALAHSLPKDFDFWKEYNFAMLERAQGLIILTIDGWKESKGMTAEIAYARELGLPIAGLPSSAFLPCKFHQVHPSELPPP